jgi:hypothetical protein
MPIVPRFISFRGRLSWPIDDLSPSFGGARLPPYPYVLLGVLSMRAPGKRLEWDGQKLEVRNSPELNQYIHKEYRKGWSL